MRGPRLSFGGFNYTGLLWVVALVAGATLLYIDKCMRPRVLAYFPAVPWLLWIGYVFGSLLWVDDRSMMEVQYAVQLGMPILIGIAASQFVRTRGDLELLVRTYFWTIPLLAAFSFLCVFGGLEETKRTDLFVQVRAISLTLVLIAALFMAGSPQNALRGWLGWGVCLAITLITGSRTASVVILMLPILNPVVRGLWRKMFAVAFVLIAGAAAISMPQVQERFLGDATRGFSRLQRGEINSSGRFDVWPIVYEEAWKRPWLGHGVGTVQNLTLEIWEGIPHPHNDYLRIGYELGLVGLVSFLLIFVWQLAFVWWWIRNTTGLVQQVFGAVFLGWLAFIPIAFTDNPITYTLPWMNPLFALLGAAATVAREEQFAQSSSRREAVVVRPASSIRQSPRLSTRY
jgi:O-antigen ligase